MAGCAPDPQPHKHSPPSDAARLPDTNAVSRAPLETRDYVLAQRDTLAGIARKFQISVEDLKAINPDLETGPIHLGQQVRVYAHPQSPYLNGRAVAQMDVQRGRLRVRTYGLPAPWLSLYSSKLLRQYQIELCPVAGDLVEPELIENVKGYNEISEAEIDRRYGPGLLDRVAKESEQAYLQSFTHH